jgi:DNA-binding LytR/AlgR family response regulator
MEKVNCILLDDEPLAMDVIESHVSKFPHLHIDGKYRNAADAHQAISNKKPDVIFLDIQMPEVTGIQFMESIQGSGIPVVFTTAYPDYAVEAFNLEALDYLVKPISLDRFRKTVERLDEFLRIKKSGDGDDIKMEDGHIFVKSDSKYVRLSYDEILYIEAFADYVKIYIGEDKRIITLQTMKNMEATLPSDKFARVHRSYIVALNKVESLSGSEVNVANKQIPIGKNYKEAFMEMMQKQKFLK